MAFQLTDDDITPIVKNTFITMSFHLPCVAPRSSSVPASSRLCHEGHPNICDVKTLADNAQSVSDFEMLADNVQSDVSTSDAGASDSESGTRTPMSLDDLSPALSFASLSEVSPPLFYTSYLQNTCFQPTVFPVAPPPEPYTQRLNANAAIFQPSFKEVAQVHELHEEIPCNHYKKPIAEVIRLAKVAMTHDEHVRQVEIFEDAGCWSINIQPRAIGENGCQTEFLLNLAKEALLDAAEKSKCIYVMGYAAPQPFNMGAQGFEATLAVMKSQVSSCWHIFKKGFCGHGDHCSKQHPIIQIPVRVLVEGVQLRTIAGFDHAFKEHVHALARTVTMALGENPHVKLVEAFDGTNRHVEYQGWTIELTGRDVAVDKEYLLTLAKNALLGATGNSDSLYIIGRAGKPFMQKSQGFVTIIGDVADISKVCWDLYSDGVCNRCDCRWAHPECLMPINVVVKEDPRNQKVTKRYRGREIRNKDTGGV